MKFRNSTDQPLLAAGFGGVVVAPDEVVEVPDHIAADITEGRTLVDLSTWTVVDGDVPNSEG